MADRANSVRLLVVDDRPLVRAGITEIVTEDVSIEVVGAAGTASEALQLALSESPDVMLVSMHLRANQGWQLISKMRQVCPLTECVALSDSDDAETFRGALECGAHGYLLDGASCDDIRLAVHRVAAGKSHIDLSVSGHLVHARLGRRGREEASLTSREVSVVSLAARGLTNDAIAHALGIKTETVKTHLSRAFERLGAHDRANAVAICMRRGLF